MTQIIKKVYRLIIRVFKPPSVNIIYLFYLFIYLFSLFMPYVITRL